MATDIYPYLFRPIYKDYIWGGFRIGRVFNRSRIAHCAESWEISDRPDGDTPVANGLFAGAHFRTVVELLGPRLVGTAAKWKAGSRFPLLIKLIDARQRLSVQVHPDARSAAVTQGDPKSEMWYVLKARKDAHVYAGLVSGTHRRTFERAVMRGAIETVLTRLLVRPGQAISIPGGRVHAIGEGCLMLEVQQNSNTTYRVHDWNRRDGATGRPRELHMEKAIRCIRWDDAPARLITPRFTETAGELVQAHVTRSPFFQVREYRLRAGQSFRNSGRSFHAYFTAAGRARISAGGVVADTAPGVSFLLPAAARTYRVDPLSPEVRLIRATL